MFYLEGKKSSHRDAHWQQALLFHRHKLGTAMIWAVHRHATTAKELFKCWIQNGKWGVQARWRLYRRNGVGQGGELWEIWALFRFAVDGFVVSHTEKSICQRTVRATTIPRPPLKSSRQGKFRSSGFHFLWSFVDLLFLKQVKIWSQQKGTRQIWIRLIKYSSFEVSDPSEVPWINGNFFC